MTCAEQPLLARGDAGSKYPHKTKLNLCTDNFEVCEESMEMTIQYHVLKSIIQTDDCQVLRIPQ